MDFGGRLGSLVKGSQGNLVIGWQNIEVCVCVSVCVCVWERDCLTVCTCSQAMPEYCKAKYVASARLHSFLDAHMLPSPCSRVDVALMYNRHSILFPWAPIPNSHLPLQQYRQDPNWDSAWQLDCAPASFLIVPCPGGCQELAGRGWTFSPGGMRRDGWDRTLAMSGAGAEKRDGEGADKLTMGSWVVRSHSLRWERRQLYVRGKHTGGVHLPALVPLHSQLLSASLLTDTTARNTCKGQNVVWVIQQQ